MTVSPMATTNSPFCPVALIDRKHFTPPASLSTAATAWIDFDGVQTTSQVWLNGEFLGEWGYGYTGSRYFVNSSQVKYGEENILVVRVDATNPDGWWYNTAFAFCFHCLHG